jgi:hypothetical protein
MNLHMKLYHFSKFTMNLKIDLLNFLNGKACKIIKPDPVFTIQALLFCNILALFFFSFIKSTITLIIS